MKNIRNWFKKSRNFSLVLLVAAILGVGLTVAYLTDIEAAFNNISFSKVEVTPEEQTHQNLTKTEVGIKVTGTSKCYVRVAVEVPNISYLYENEKKEADITLADETTHLSASEWQTYKNSISAKVNGKISSTAIWEKNGNYWYLSVPLNRNDKAIIIDKIEYEGLWDETQGKMVLPDGITKDMLSILITAEAVQADGLDLDLKEGDNASLKAFEKVDPNSTE